MKLITLVGAGLFIVGSAFTLKKEKHRQDLPLYATKWVLKKTHSGGTEQVVDIPAFLRFNREKGSAGGNGGCNSFGSTLSVKGNQVGFRDIFSTKMFCEGAQATEDLFFRLLEKVNRYEITGSKLNLYRDRELLLEFEAG